MNTHRNAAGQPVGADDTPERPSPQKKLRLVKVLVQPVVMLDDGTTLTEVEHPAVAIPAEEWATYSSDRFPAEMAAWEKALNEPLASGA